MEEYYPNALEETYNGVAGYIYTAKDITDSGYCIGIPAKAGWLGTSASGSESRNSRIYSNRSAYIKK